MTEDNAHDDEKQSYNNYLKLADGLVGLNTYSHVSHTIIESPTQHLV